MRSDILKFFSFLFTLTLLSCGGGGGDDTGGGGGGGGGGGPTPTPPGKATLVAPANNKTCETGTSVSDTQSTVTFNWNASANTNTYDVQITNLNTSTATNKNGVSSTSTTATLDKGVPYSWRVTSKNTTTTTSTPSDLWKFYYNWRRPIKDPIQFGSGGRVDISYNLCLGRKVGRKTPSRNEYPRKNSNNNVGNDFFLRFNTLGRFNLKFKPNKYSNDYVKTFWSFSYLF